MSPLRPSKVALSLCLFSLFFFGAASLDAAVVTSFTSGSWSSGGTWTGGNVPAAGDDVVIAGGTTVTMSAADVATIQSLVIQAGGSLNLGTAGTLSVTGDVDNDGQLMIGGGHLKLAGDYSATTALSGGSGTITLNGAAFQSWSGPNISVNNLTISNSFSDPADYSGAVEFWSSITVGGTLSFQTGVLSVVGTVTLTPTAVIQRTSGHLRGKLAMPMPAGQAVAFPLGTAEFYMPLTITSPTAGTLTAGTLTYRTPEAGANSLAGGYWELWTGDIPSLTQIVFGYAAAQVTGSEASYVAGRLESYGASWQRFTTTVDTAAHTATATGPFPPNGSWTLAEPWAVTTATQFSVRYAGTGNPRINTPFTIALDAKDGSGNPAVFTSYINVSVELSSTPTAPTGTLTNEWGDALPLYFGTPEGGSTALFENLTYDKQESITLIIKDSATSARFSPLSLPLTFDPPASALVVTTTSSGGDGSLGQAIRTANAGGCTTVPCPISFNIPEAMKSTDGTWKIVMAPFEARSQARTVASSTSDPLPYVDVPVTIDGTTQPGFSTAGRPVIEIDGGGGYGTLYLFGSSTVRGLAFSNADAPLYLTGNGGHKIEGCYVGLTATGALPADQYMYTGIEVDSSNNLIGGPSPAQRNVIADAWEAGIYLGASATGNSIRGNYIGTDPTGSTAIGNWSGIMIEGSGNTVGGESAGEGNLISGNDQGVVLQAIPPMVASSLEAAVATSEINRVLGNTIGMTANGGQLPNTFAGVAVLDVVQHSSAVGGPTTGQANVIAHGTGVGVEIDGPVGVVVSGNTYYGTGMSIDLNGDGTPLDNDTGDGDTNEEACEAATCITANNGQNTPVISSAKMVGTTLEATLSVDSAEVTATQSLRVELYREEADGTRQMISSGCFPGNIISAATLTVPNAAIGATTKVLATATSYTVADCQPSDGQGNSTVGDGVSEFSPAVAVDACNAPLVTVAPSTAHLCGTTSVTLSASVSGGTGSYASYQWYNGTTPITNATAATYVATAAGSYTVVVTDSSGCTGSGGATVTQNAAVTVAITASGPTTFCDGGSVTLSASASGGTGTYSTYKWFNGTTEVASTPTLTVSESGTYRVVVTDSKGCSGEASQSATKSATTVSVSASGPTTFCSGGSVTLTATPSGGVGGGYTYQWMNGTTPITDAQSSTYVATASGTYSVTVSDGTSCTPTASSSVTVTVNAAPSPAISGPTSVCSGGSVTLDAGAGFSTYAWSNGASTQTITVSPTATTSYTVAVTTSAGCTATSPSHTVSVNAAPTPTISGPTSVCSGGSVSLDAGAGFSTYAWSNGATTQTITVSPTTTTSYTVAVTTSAGCTATSPSHTVNVTTAPAPTISGPTSVCSGGSVTLDAGAGFSTYAWSNGATTQTITVSPTATTSYTVAVTTSAGCTATSPSHTVNVTTAPAPTISGPTSVCSGGSVTLDAGAGFSTYSWSNGATTQTITVSPTATTFYTVTVRNSAGCTTTSPSHTVSVTPAPRVVIDGPSAVCDDTSFTLDAGAGYDTYSWSNGATTQTITVAQAQAQTYTVQVTKGGCTSSASKTVAMSAAAIASITAPSSVEALSTGNTATVPAQDGATYAWAIDNGSITGGQGTNAITFTAGSQGTLMLQVTVTIGACASSSSATVSLTESTADLAVQLTAPAQVRGGDPFNYAIAVRNNGPAVAPNGIVSMTLPAGMTVTGTSGGWLCSVDGQLVTCSAALVRLGEAGTITVGVRAPSAAGTLTAIAQVSAGAPDPNGSNNSASATTEVVAAVATCPTVAPSLVSPADNAVGASSPVTFSWNAVDGATGYELWMSVATGAQLLGTTTSTSLSAAVPSGAMTWYVVARAGNNCGSLTSASRRLTVAPSDNCPTTAPGLLSPAAGTTLDSPVTFTWSAVSGAIGYRVLVGVAGEATLQDVGTTTGALTLTATVPSGSVQAFVEAILSGCPPTRSAGVAFTVAAPDPCADRSIAPLTAPANDATVNSSLVRLEWGTAAGADGYRVWAAVDDGAPALIGTTEGETFLQATFARGTITWWVEALYDGCASTDSAQRRFTIPPATNCGTALADPILPLNGAVLPNKNVTFSWANVPSAVEYELWLSLGEGTATLFGETDGATTSLTAPVPAGAMKWFVRARVDRCPPRDSAAAEFSHQPPSSCATNQRPLLVFPADGERLTSPVNLRWSTPPGATRFEILVDRGNGPIVAASSTGGSADNVSLPTGRVKWFARAYYGDSCAPLDSAEQSIQVLPPPAVCGTLAAPAISAPGQISSGISFRIHWNPIPGATSYNLQLASRPDFGDAELISLTSAEYQLTRENPTPASSAVYARVRAVDSRCNPAAFGPFGATSAIYILPVGSAEGGRLASDTGLIQSTIFLPAELAGQAFTATPSDPWLTVTPTTGVVGATGTTLNVTADTRALPLGTTLGGVTVSVVAASSGRLASQGTTITTTPIAVNLVTPVTQTPKSAPPPDALIIPAVAHADGFNAKFQSDVRVTNTSAQLMKYLVTFTPTGGEGIAAGRQTSIAIEPGRTVALDDVLKTWFGTGTTSTTGTLEIRPQTQAFASTSSAMVKGLANLATFASSRTFNMTANGSFGQHIPAIPFANFIGKAAANTTGTILSLQQIAQSDRFRTNLGLVEGSGNPASLLVSVFGKSGEKLTSFALDLKGGQHTQLNSFLAERGITSLDDGRVEVAVLSGIGKVTAYASVLDNKTSDPLLVTPVALSESGDTKWVVPGVADLNNGFVNWQTDLRIFNGESEPVETTLSFHSQNGGEPRTTTLTIPPGEVRQLDRALSSLFSLSNDGGALHLSTSKASKVIATARTYNLTSNGTYGQFISAVTPSDAATVGSRPLQLLQIEESDRFRTNLGLAEVSGKPVKVSISVIPPDFSKVTAFLELELAANEFRQIGSILKTMGLTNTHNARITVRAISGTGRVAAYASVIDLLTQDPTYIPAQ